MKNRGPTGISIGLIFALISVILLFGVKPAIAEEQSDTITIPRSEFEAIQKRLKELEAEMKKMRRIEKELKELKKKFERIAPSVESGEESLVIEPPRKFLGLFGEISETVPSLDLSGFVTVSYRHTNIENRGRFTFDVVEINPRFNLFEELQIGMDMEFSEPTPDEDDFYVEQAFIRWVPYTDKPFEITMGRFNSILGIEHPDPSNRLLATTSLLTANFIPGDQTGAVIAWKRDNFRVFLAAANSFGYNNKGERISTDNNFDKTWTVRVEWRPADLKALGVNFVAGPERDGNNHDYRYVVDLDYQCACEDVYYVGLEFLYGFEENEIAGDASWWGMMGIFNYRFSQQLDASVRLEYVNDADGGSQLGILSSGRGAKLWSAALALRFHPLTNMNIVLEYRHDNGTDEFFVSEEFQNTFSVQVTVTF